MKIRNPETGEYVNIYSARLTFVRGKNGNVSENVRVTIYYHGKKRPKRKDFLIPEEIDTNGLDWIKEKGIAVYYREKSHERRGDYDYTSKGMTISTGLSQKLEDLVLKACFENSNKKERKK